MNSHIKCYHAYTMKWNPTLEEFLKAHLELENEFDKFAVAFAKCDVSVGYLSKGKTGQFPKTISFFLRESNKHSCEVEVIGKRVNLGHGEGRKFKLTRTFLPWRLKKKLELANVRIIGVRIKRDKISDFLNSNSRDFFEIKEIRIRRHSN